MAESSLQNLQRLQAQYVRNQRERAQRAETMRRRIKHTAYWLFIIILFVAGILDLSNYLKDAIDAIPAVGWLIGIAISLLRGLIFVPIMYSMRKRIKKINTAGQQIAQSSSALHRQTTIARQRLQPAVMATRNVALWRATDPARSSGFRGFVVHKGRVLLNSLIAQLADSIPLVDLLPIELGNVLRIFWQQQKEFRIARNLLLEYQSLSEKLGRLEQFEIEYTARVIAAALQVYARSQQRSTQRRAPAPQRQPAAVPTLEPRFAT